jgi:hypothetical protein
MRGLDATSAELDFPTVFVSSVRVLTFLPTRATERWDRDGPGLVPVAMCIFKMLNDEAPAPVRC